MKYFLMAMICITFYSCEKRNELYDSKRSPFNFTLFRNNIESNVVGKTPIASATQGQIGTNIDYVVRATESGIGGTPSGLALRVPYSDLDGDFTTDDFKTMFNEGVNYDLTTWNDGASLYYGIKENGEVVQYISKPSSPHSSFHSYFAITSFVDSNEKTEDGENYYIATAEFDADMINQNDPNDVIRITNGFIEFWVVDFQSN